MVDMSVLSVGDTVVRIKGFKNLIGLRYKVLSITLTDVYLQNVVTNRCHNYPIKFLKMNHVKV